MKINMKRVLSMVVAVVITGPHVATAKPGSGPSCIVLTLYNKCEHDTKFVNNRADPDECAAPMQGDMITHRSMLNDEDGNVVGYLHSTCIIMYDSLHVAVGAAEILDDAGTDLDGTTLQFQGFFEGTEPHGDFEFGITTSTGEKHGLGGWIEMNMESVRVQGKGTGVVIHACQKMEGKRLRA